MDIATGGIMVAILNKKDAKKLDLHSGDRILVKDHSKEVTCILDISESKKAVSEGKIGLFEEVLRHLGVRRGNTVSVKYTGKPESIKHIRDKLYGKHLNYTELYHIIDDITHDRLTDIEKTYFVAAGFVNKFSTQEVVDLTKAMVETGQKLKFKGVTLDKHCVGGVPGNRTTMVVVPIVAAAGFTLPKTSSRAITSAAGTADAMECLAQVELSRKKIKQVVHATGACIVHGGSIHLAPADDKIIEVEHPLSIDAEGQLLASVMAKKFSVTASHVLIDIPMGKSVKAKTKKQALHLKSMFELIGKRLGMQVKVMITNGSQPIGYGIGPLLEALAGLMLEMTGKYKDGMAVARKLLEDGSALRKMHQIIAAQGKVPKPVLGHYTFVARSTKSGKVREIDNEIIAKIARIAGAPEDKGSGLLLEKKVGELVSKGKVLYTVYAESSSKLDLAVDFLKENKGYHIGD